MSRLIPAGHFPINVLFPHVVVAGCSLVCGHCAATGRAPLPRAAGYGAALEAWLAEHRDCPADADRHQRKGVAA